MTLIYPGSFDPVTLGHTDIALRGAKIATKLVVAVLDNPNKKALFSVEERVAFLQDALGHVGNIHIGSFSGLLVDYAGRQSATAILRGLRSPGDFESEGRYAICNRLLSASGLETIFITASPSLSFISSSIVREAAFYIGSLDESALGAMVSPTVLDALKKIYEGGKAPFRLE